MLDRPDDVALLSMREQARRAGVPPATMTRLAKRLGLEGYDAGARALCRRGARRHPGLRRQGGRAGRGAEAARRAGARGRDGAQPVARDRAPRRARIARPPGRRGRPPARGAARLLPGPALLPRRRLALPLHAVAAGRQDGDAGRCRRHRPRRHPRRRPAATCCWPPASSPMPAPPSTARATPPARACRSWRSTDSEVSPLAQIASATILVATESPSFFHTMTPLLAVAEILAALVAGRGGKKALAALEHTEAQLVGVRRPPAAARRHARKHDPHPASPDRRNPAGRRRRPGHRDRRHRPASATSTRRAARRCRASAMAIPP